MTLMRERFENALNDIQQGGVHIVTNVMTCCRGCTEKSDLGLAENSTQPWAFHFGGQDLALEWSYDKPVHREEGFCQCEDDEWNWDEENQTDILVSEGYVCQLCEGYDVCRLLPASKIYFNHSGADAAKAVVAGFQKNGFDAQWSGSDTETVIVNFN